MRQNGGFPPVGEPGSPSSLTFPPGTGSFIKWVLVALGVLLLLFLLNTLRSIYTDWLWFNNVGYLDVFTTILWTRVWLFLAGAAVVSVIAGLNLWWAHRNASGESALPLPAATLYWLDRLMLVGSIVGAVVIAIFFGLATSTRWELVLRLVNSVPFDTSDPVFGRDVSFFVFTLPLWRFLQGWSLAVFIVLLVAVALVYLGYYAIRGIPFSVTRSMRNHLATLGALAFFSLAASHLLDRFELVFSSSGAVVGATYADVNARLLVFLVLAFIAFASGAMLLATLHPSLEGTKGTRLIVGAVGLWIAAVLLGGNLYPAFVQRFRVEPNELELEKPYIARNIQFTRDGFGLDTIREQPYDVAPDITAQDIQENEVTVRNVRLWDPRPLQLIYNQVQHLRLYYEFGNIDVDRYRVGGQYRQVLLGARELTPENLPAEAQRWVNQRLQYTHGYGLAASPATEFTEGGKPDFFVQDVPPKGEIAVSRPQVYYGENTRDFVVVNTLQQEFDHPTEQDIPQYRNYDGTGGVHLGSFLRKLTYAWEMADINILISSPITDESRIQYRRHIQDRVGAVAPFLTLDSDPYLVVDGQGRLMWIQDAYTVTDRYPYSQPFEGSFNYARNSVKVVIDAYNGTMDFYVADPSDPLVQTYAGIFPSLFQPLEAMPQYLQAHIRYPGDLFSWQAQTYLQYHMTDSTVFFNKEDQWSIPGEVIFEGTQQPVEPYYVIMRLPGAEEAEFVLILPFTPADKPNMVAWLAARMDGPHYGELITFNFPRGLQIDGPIQIEARIDNDTRISEQFTLWGQSGSTVIRGNLLVIPLGDTILYVEPVYLQAEGVDFPELKRVILASSNRVVMEPTLDEAIAALLGRGIERERQPEGEPADLTDAAQQVERIREALRSLQEGFTSLEDALAELEKILQGEQAQ